MESQRKAARIAGLLYLIVVLTGIFALAYVPSKLIDWDNATETFANITASETLFRLSIVAGVICYTAFLILPFVLYRLLNHVSRPHAIVMVILSAVSVPISLYNLVHKVNVLTLIHSEKVVEIDRLPAQVLLSLNYYDNGIQIVSIFWGLWLLPFGYLVFKSGFLPRILGIFLMVGCFGYLMNFTGGFLIRNYSDLGIARFVSLPASIGEIGICLWLLVIGIRTKSIR
jgi:hypothetical protein